MSSRPFTELRLVHQLPGRLRYRYLSSQAQLVEAELQDALGPELHLSLRTRARSLVIEFSPGSLEEAEVRGRLLELELPQKPGALGALESLSQPHLPKFGLWASGLGLLLGPLLPSQWRAAWAMLSSLPLLQGAAEDLQQLHLSSHGLEAAAVGISIWRRDYGAASAAAFMIALGEAIEESISRRSDQMLKGLLHPSSGRYWVSREEQELQIDSPELLEGDTVILAAGEVVPVDGTVLSGLATLNEASMTGESYSAEKTRGARVLAGTVIQEGQLRVYAERVGAQTLASRIAGYVEESLAEKSQVQLAAARLADRAVPIVLGLSGLAYAWSRDTNRAAAVLQADFSCAIKLSTPVALKSTMSRAGHDSILFKGAVALEALAQADTFVFDKTGTLTTGRLELLEVLVYDQELSSEALVGLAASIEEHYVHPLAQAVVEAAHRLGTQHFEHTEVDFVVSHGVASTISGKRIVVGSRHFVEDDEGIPLEQHRQELEALERSGKTLLYIGYGGCLAGVLVLRDSLRTDARETLARLRELGVRQIYMLTGDREERAQELARELGIDKVYAELLPNDKSRLVEELSSQVGHLAFIGDGINDAPALAKASVGISMQKGADIAKMSSDVALLADQLSKVADAKAYARAGLALVQKNQSRAIAINSGILALASLGWLSPVWTAALHNGTTIWLLGRAMTGGRGLRRRRLGFPNAQDSTMLAAP